MSTATVSKEPVAVCGGCRDWYATEIKGEQDRNRELGINDERGQGLKG